MISSLHNVVLLICEIISPLFLYSAAGNDKKYPITTKNAGFNYTAAFIKKTSRTPTPAGLTRNENGKAEVPHPGIKSSYFLPTIILSRNFKKSVSILSR